MSRIANTFRSALAVTAMAALATVAKADHEIAPPAGPTVGPPSIAPSVQYRVAYSMPCWSTRTYATYAQACHFRDWLTSRAGVNAAIRPCFRGYEVSYACRRALTRTFFTFAAAREFRSCLSDCGFTCRVRTLRQPGCNVCAMCGGVGACKPGCTGTGCQLKGNGKGGGKNGGAPLGPLTGLRRFRH